MEHLLKEGIISCELYFSILTTRLIPPIRSQISIMIGWFFFNPIKSTKSLTIKRIVTANTQHNTYWWVVKEIFLSSSFNENCIHPKTVNIYRLYSVNELQFIIPLTSQLRNMIPRNTLNSKSSDYISGMLAWLLVILIGQFVVPFLFRIFVQYETFLLWLKDLLFFLSIWERFDNRNVQSQVLLRS